MEQLTKNIEDIYLMIDELTEEAPKTATCEVYKFLHVNTVGPFGTFRNKTRKCNKVVLYIKLT